MRREYPAQLVINGQKIEKVVIDSHYEEKHSESVNDQIILELVKQLDSETFDPEKVDGKVSYFKYEGYLDDKKYRLIWLLIENTIFIGIVNCFRSD